MRDVRLDEALGLLTLRGLNGFGPVTIEKILGRFDTIGDLATASPEACKGVLNKRQHEALREPMVLPAAHDAARREVDRAAELQISILTPSDEGYPSRLAAIPEPPQLLYVLGDLRPAERSVACVGTRYPSKFGRVVTDRFVAAAAPGGWSIVSGLAEGIDEAAHEAALLHGAHTVAVIACGMDMLYDERQRDLAGRILGAGGAMVSEQAFGAASHEGSLIRRNRIQSGLSAGVVVLQARAWGGTLQTARYALTQGRPLFAPVPPPQFAGEEACGGLSLLTGGTGPALAQAIGATKPDFLGRMHKEFADRPVAIPIRDRGDFPSVLARLEEELAPEPVAAYA